MNNIFLGADPLLNGNNSSITRQQIEAQEQYLAKLKSMNINIPETVISKTEIWDKIDDEMSSLNEIQKENLAKDNDYIEVFKEVQSLIDQELLNQIKPIIERSELGKSLLNNLLSITKKKKKSIIEQTNQDLNDFNQWKEFASKNPSSTYQDFLNTKK